MPSHLKVMSWVESGIIMIELELGSNAQSSIVRVQFDGELDKLGLDSSSNQILSFDQVSQAWYELDLKVKFWLTSSLKLDWLLFLVINFLFLWWTKG